MDEHPDHRVERLLAASNEASGQARTSWITFILLGTYLAVTVGATTDKQILLETPARLPLLGVDLPLAGFYAVAPWLFVLFHLYLLVQLYLLSRTLHLFDDELTRAPMIEGDRVRMRARLNKFVFTQLIAGANREWLPRQFLRLAAWITLLGAPILLLLAFQVRFLPFHDAASTWSHRAALLVDLAAIWILWPAIVHPSGRLGGALTDLARRIFLSTPAALYDMVRRTAAEFETGGWKKALTPGAAVVEDAQQEIRKAAREIGRLMVLVVTSGVTILFSLLVATVPGEGIEREMLETGRLRTIAPLELFIARGTARGEKPIMGVQAPSATATGGPAGFPTAVAPLVATDEAAIRLARCLENQARPADWRRIFCALDPAFWSMALERSSLEDGQARVWLPTWLLFEGEIDEVRSRVASPLSRNLVLIDADLIGLDSDRIAKTERTLSLRGRDLRFATLSRADLRKADLTGADLRGANLFQTRLQEASLQKARLQGADLRFAQMQGATLIDARLQGARLQYAELRGANLQSARLQNANLQNAKLQGATLFGAKLQGADLDDAALQGANLGNAKLQGAMLFRARLQGATLIGANLRAARLLDARLHGAHLQSTNLEGANLRGARLQGANLRGARFQGADFRSAGVWRADAGTPAFNGPEPDLADGRFVNTTALSAKQVESLIARVAEEVPEGGRRRAALLQLRVLKGASDPALDSRWPVFWDALRKRGWNETTDDPRLAQYLGDLGCAPGEAPHIAGGLARRVRWERSRLYARLLAGRLLDPACAGARALGIRERRFLEELARQG